MPGPHFLISFHCPSNTGYAIAPLEQLFFEVVEAILGDARRIHLSYSDTAGGPPPWLPDESNRPVSHQYRTRDRGMLREVAQYVSRNRIRYVLAFDLPVGAPIIKAWRRGGVERIIAYWGAPMSTLNSGLKLLAKQVEVLLRRDKPDHFIFESQGMRMTGVHGRGIAIGATSVVPLGVDVQRYGRASDRTYIYRNLKIPSQRKIVFYSGHMQRRKGVHILLLAATELVDSRRRRDVHFVLCGNRSGEEAAWATYFRGTAAEDHITFGGYRHDIPDLLPGCYLGVIPSTGWDSFTMSSLEMAAAGLPLIVSNLPGLNEAIERGVTGEVFEPGNHLELSRIIEQFLDDEQLRVRVGANAKRRVTDHYTRSQQAAKLSDILRKTTGL